MASTEDRVARPERRWGCHHGTSGTRRRRNTLLLLPPHSWHRNVCWNQCVSVWGETRQSLFLIKPRIKRVVTANKWLNNLQLPKRFS